MTAKTAAAITPADLRRLEAAVAQLRAAEALAETKADDARPGTLRRSVSVARHHSYLAAPAYVAAADVAALLGHLAPGPLVLGSIGSASAVIGTRAAWRHRKRKPRARWYAGTAWTLGTAAALGGAEIGVTGPVGQALVLGGGLAVAAPWLRAQRRRFHEPGPAAVPVVQAAARERPEVAAFREAFCLKDGPLAFAEPGGYMPIDNGFQLPLQLVRGKQTTATAARIQDNIASLYDVPWEQVSVEHDASRSRSRALVTVIIDGRQFTDLQVWEGSTLDLENGLITAGYFGDGKPARYRLWTPGSGAAHCIVTGSTGAGKSGFLSLLLAEAGVARDAQGRRLVRRWIIDPQAQSLPGWTGRVDLTALGVDSSMAALRAMFAALVARSARLGNTSWTDSKGREIRGVGRFRPTADQPLILCLVDEMHLLLTDKVYAAEAEFILSQIGKLGRKAGMALVGGSQLAGLAELKSRALRQSLASMQAVAFRSAENLNGSFLGIEGQPFHLPPEIPGLGFMNSVDRRSAATMRSVWVGEEEAEVDAAELAGVLPLDGGMRDDITAAAARPVRVPGSPKWMPSWEYTGAQDGVGQVIRDAA